MQMDGPTQWPQLDWLVNKKSKKAPAVKQEEKKQLPILREPTKKLVTLRKTNRLSDALSPMNDPVVEQAAYSKLMSRGTR